MNKDEIVEHMIEFIENEEKELQNKENQTAKEMGKLTKKIIDELERVMQDEN